MLSLLCFLIFSPFIISSSEHTAGFIGSSRISPKDSTPVKPWPLPRIPGTSPPTYVNIAGFGSGQDWTIICGNPDEHTQCLLYERQGTPDWGTREILHQDAPPNGRQEWGRYADADGNFAAVTAIRQRSSFTQEVQVHLWRYNYVGTHNTSYVNTGMVLEEYWVWVHPDPFTFYYDGFARPFKVAVDASGIVVVWGLTQDAAGQLTEGEIHIWGYNETFNQWDKLSRNLLNDQDFIPVLCHHCDELELVVKPGGDEIYLVSTIENGARIEKQGIYRLRRENHYHLEKNDESSILANSVMEVDGDNWKVRELMYVNNKLIVALKHSSKIFIIDVENNNHMVVNDVGTIPKLIAGDGDLFYTVHVDPEACVDRVDELRAAKSAPSITCQSEWDRLQECEFPFSWGALQDYCCETCAPHVDFEPKNMTTVRVWGIGAYLDDLELVEVGSIDPFSYCILSPDVTVEEIVASGNYLHVAIKACHNIYTMTISDVEINRITTTGTPDVPCQIEAFVKSLGDSMVSVKSNSTEDCGVFCKYDERCSHWTYEIATEECALHQHFYGQEPNVEFVSGTRCEGIIPSVCMLTQQSPEFLECQQEQWLRYDLTNLGGPYACPLLSNFVKCLTMYDCSELLPKHLKEFRQESCNFAFCEKDSAGYQECVSAFNAEESNEGVVTCESMDTFETCIAICDLTNYQQSLKEECQDQSLLANNDNAESPPISADVVMILAIILSGIVIGSTLCYLTMHRRQRTSDKRKPEDRRRDPAFRLKSVQIGSSPREGGRTRDRSESRDILGRPKKRFAAKEATGTKRRPESEMGSSEPAWKRKPARNDPARKKKDPTANGTFRQYNGSPRRYNDNTASTPPVMTSHLRTPPDNYNNSFLVGTPSVGGNMLVSQSRPRTGSDATFQSEV